MDRVVASMLKALGSPAPAGGAQLFASILPETEENQKMSSTPAELHLTRKRVIWGWRSSIGVLERRKAEKMPPSSA